MVDLDLLNTLLNTIVLAMVVMLFMVWYMNDRK